MRSNSNDSGGSGYGYCIWSLYKLEEKKMRNKIISFLLGCLIGLSVCLPAIWELIERMVKGG